MMIAMKLKEAALAKLGGEGNERGGKPRSLGRLAAGEGRGRMKPMILASDRTGKAGQLNCIRWRACMEGGDRGGERKGPRERGSERGEGGGQTFVRWCRLSGGGDEMIRKWCPKSWEKGAWQATFLFDSGDSASHLRMGKSSLQRSFPVFCAVPYQSSCHHSAQKMLKSGPWQWAP